MLRERPGNLVVLSGRNRGKIDRIVASVRGGLNVLADKPWILKSEDLPKVEAALAEADAKGVVAYDIMTERFELTSILQRALVNDAATFGEMAKGTEADPAVYMESVHHLMKTVAGAPNIRPAWFFDTAEQGEGLNDIGTHLVDLVQWTLFPDKTIDYKSDVRVLAAQRWPTVIPEDQFRRVTGEPRFPASLAASIKDGKLEYYANTLVSYTLRGVHTKLNVIWDWEAPPDPATRISRSTRARARASRSARRRPIATCRSSMSSRRRARTRRRCSPPSGRRSRRCSSTYPGIGVDERNGDIHVIIPEKLREGHEAHFAQVTAGFLKYLRQRGTLPAWERPNMAAKYFVTTTGTELSRKSPARPAARIAPR